MWKKFLQICIILIPVGIAFLFGWMLYLPAVDQSRIPIFIAAIASILSAIGVIASWLVVIEMRKDREALYKPDIYADFEVEEGAFSFVVQNAGLTAAKKVKVEIIPPPFGSDNKPIENVVWLKKPIETLLPGKSLKRFCNVSHQYYSSGAPLKYSISLSYNALTGKQYTDGPYIIDLEEYRNSTIPCPSPETSLKHIADDLKKIAENK